MGLLRSLLRSLLLQQACQAHVAPWLCQCEGRTPGHLLHVVSVITLCGSGSLRLPVATVLSVRPLFIDPY
jgi:hypothetical protein